ncbi:MAG: ComEA family DNA-binding protein [Planctomycetota bacterium]
MEQSQPTDDQIKLWTRSMLVAAGCAVVLLLILTCGIYSDSHHPPLTGVPETINPNTAPAASLVRLPGIGPARALDIIHYREHAENQPAFGSAADMQAIKGIGPKTAENIAPYLTFASEAHSE